MNILKERDVNKDCLKGKTVAVIGYGSQGRAQANSLRDSGVNVILGLRENSLSRESALKDKFQVFTVTEAAERGDIVHILIPDETQEQILNEQVLPFMSAGKTLSFSHGFCIHFGKLKLRDDIDVILVAPKGPGTEVRRTYLDGFGVPGLIAVQQDSTGSAWDTALSLAHGMGLTRAGVIKTTFKEEACEDLFGEQAVLCGGLFELMKAGYEILTEAGYPSEMAYFETVHEMKLIVDLIYEGGIGRMADVISNTAEWGMYTSGPAIINDDVKKRMRNVLDSIENGEFARHWQDEYKTGLLKLKKQRENLKMHDMEKTGESIRMMYNRVN